MACIQTFRTRKVKHSRDWKENELSFFVDHVTRFDALCNIT